MPMFSGVVVAATMGVMMAFEVGVIRGTLEAIIHYVSGLEGAGEEISILQLKISVTQNRGVPPSWGLTKFTLTRYRMSGSK